MTDYKSSNIPRTEEIDAGTPSFPIPGDQEIHNLPSFPDSPMKKGFSQSIIKDTIETGDTKEDLPEIPGFKGERIIKNEPMRQKVVRPQIIEMEEWKPSRFPESTTEIETPKLSPHKQVFVKLEKFQSARRSIETVRTKLEEIDELLQTIREVKQKEDQEISIWEKEIENIKSRISSISSEIFDNPQ